MWRQWQYVEAAGVCGGSGSRWRQWELLVVMYTCTCRHPHTHARGGLGVRRFGLV
jgi:hypothetical protein